ncbi:MAG: desulfoferrodoxin family protein [Treponemataceae bacterium]
MKDLSFFTTDKGKTFIGLDVCKDATITCCDGNKKYEAVKVGSVDAAKEKHVPVVSVEGTKVKVAVGSVAHPMQDEHWIVWVCLKTEKGLQVKELKPGEKPEVEFAITADDKVIEAYEFCNLHGVWVGK